METKPEIWDILKKRSVFPPETYKSCSTGAGDPEFLKSLTAMIDEEASLGTVGKKLKEAEKKAKETKEKEARKKKFQKNVEVLDV